MTDLGRLLTALVDAKVAEDRRVHVLLHARILRRMRSPPEKKSDEAPEREHHDPDLNRPSVRQ